MDPWNYLYRFAAGTALLQARRSDLAVIELAKAVKLHPGNLDAQNNFAVALIFEKRYSEAREILIALTTRAPTNDHVGENLKMVEKMIKEKEVPR